MKENDAISRQAAIDCVTYYTPPSKIRNKIAELPSVTPKQRTGKWQEVYAETDYRNGWIEFSCENCEYQHGLESGEYGWSYGDPIPWKYCPICGARMVDPQESEKINCKTTKCENCQNHNYCDYEPQESEEV